MGPGQGSRERATPIETPERARPADAVSSPPVTRSLIRLHALLLAALPLSGCYEADRMPPKQRLVAATVAAFLVVVIFELVRKRRLREEYSWLWLLVGACVAASAFIPFDYLVLLANSMGSDNPPAAIFFLGFLGVTLLCLQFSVRLSRQTEQIKNLGQKVALLEAELRSTTQQPVGSSN